MGKKAFMFPGQGAQYAGMGKDFYDAFEESREAFDIAAQVTGLDLAALVFEEDERLNITEYTQIALFATECAILRTVEKKGLRADVNVGLSLGEYAALTASGVMDYRDACGIVRKRGIYMEHEVPAGIGTMAAVLGLNADTVSGCVREMADAGKKVYVANYNCPGQIVISGEKQDVLDAFEPLKQAGAKRVMELNVSGPFHSGMLAGAGRKLAEELDRVAIHAPEMANANAQYINQDADAQEIRRLLAEQVHTSVMFEQSVRNMIADGTDTFYEIGPGHTLTGFVKKIAKDMQLADKIVTINIEKAEDYEKL